MERKMETECDEYGDSYRSPATVTSLISCLDKVETRPTTNSKEKADLVSELRQFKYFLFKGKTFHLGKQTMQQI